MFKTFNTVLLAYFTTAVCFISLCRGDGCIPLPEIPCGCAMGNEVITLDADGFDTWTIDKYNKLKFYFAPCSTLSMVTNIGKECKDSSVCYEDLSDPKNPKWYAIGSNDIKYKGDPSTELDFVYGAQKSSNDPHERYSTVSVVCDPELLRPDLEFIGNVDHNSSNSTEYKFDYIGNAACPRAAKKKISAGSVLLILFFVGIFLYLVIGMLFNKCARGAVGLEIIPNYTFWKDLPSLVKEGAVFTFSCGCCKRDESARGYDDI